MRAERAFAFCVGLACVGAVVGLLAAVAVAAWVTFT